MVRNSMRRRTKRSRRRKNNSRRRSSLQSLVRTATSALRGINTTRTLTFIPKVVEATSTDGKINPNSSWLEAAFPYIIAAMKFFGAVVKYLSPITKLEESRIVIQSCSQTILISIDDILYKHPIVTPAFIDYEGAKREIMSVNYSMAKITRLHVVVSFMGKVSSRAGRLAIAIEPLIREKALELRETTLAAQDAKIDEERSFEQITQLPGAIVSPNLRPISVNLRPRGFSSQWVELGQAALNSGEYPKGGMPLFLLFVGYQDLASNSSDPSLAYSLEEASLCVEISGTIELKAPVTNKRYMRSVVKSLANPVIVNAVSDGHEQGINIPLHHINCREGRWLYQPELENFDTLSIN